MNNQSSRGSGSDPIRLENEDVELGASLSMPVARAVPLRPSESAEQARCRNCGYSLTGLSAPRCPECGALVPKFSGRERARAAIEAEHRFSQYWKPLIMFGVGVILNVAVITASDSLQAAGMYLIRLLLTVPIGLITYVLLALVWIGFNEPLRVISLRLLGIYAVVDLTSTLLGFVPIPIVPMLLVTFTYLGLLMSELDLDWGEASALAIATMVMRGIVGGMIIVGLVSAGVL